MTDKSWFFPDCYLREMEELCVELRKANGQSVPDSIAISEVLVMAQAFGAWKQGQVEKAGGISAWLKGERAFGHGRVEQRNKHYFKALSFVSKLEVDHVEQEPEVEEKSTDLPAVWEKFQEIYKQHAPSTWPQLVRKLGIAKMQTRLQEGIAHAGGADEFLALAASALAKVPDFYRNTYIRKGANLRPAADCILCLLSGDKNHKELGVAGWRMFEWADLMDASEAAKPDQRHPAEEYLSWTGTRWTYRRPDLDDAFLEEQRQLLIDAGLGPADT